MPVEEVLMSHVPQQHFAPALKNDTVREVISGVMSPGHFFSAQPFALEWEMAVPESGPWEVYQGRLLDRAHTRQVRTFESWNVYAVAAGRSDEALLSVKWDAAVGEIHVTRGLECYVWEGYHAGDNVYLSREVQKWVRELVGSLQLARFPDPDRLHEEIAGLIFRAVVGNSRLPLTSVESPLPGFS